MKSLVLFGRTIFFFSLYFLAFNSYCLADDETILVQTKSGPVLGQKSGEVLSFMGIPYAAAPIEDLRFAPPADPKPWSTPFKADKPGAVCFQLKLNIPALEAMNNRTVSEDCLNLNVYAPKDTKAGDALPVYVFIHGGGFAIGAGNQDIFDMSELVKRKIVAVSLNYRLGGLGFLASEETFKRYGTTGNWGLLDQIKALEWVRDNIKAFGGAPDKVTIGGESAGSMSVSALLTSPLAKGLFRGAIMESGSVLSLYKLPNNYSSAQLNPSMALGKTIMAVLGLKDDEEGLRALREIPPEVITRLTPFAFNWTKPARFTLAPVRDGYVVPLDPQSALATGNFNHVNLLIGFNSDEGALFVPEGASRDDLREMIFLTLGYQASEAFGQRFPPDKDNDPLQRARQALGLGIFTAASKRTADLHSRFAPLYMYNFNYVSPSNNKLARGALHASELGYIFSTLYDKNNPIERKLSEEMQTRWVNFVKTGNPNKGDKLPSDVQWPGYLATNPMVLKINEPMEVGPLDSESLDFMADQLYGPLSEIK
ncbi:MAG: carboxylesterase family protein [Deltaproteobacteria bacterium]|nr:carboxylesterase family protein [Deltaproteobacteria bacterium]